VSYPRQLPLNKAGLRQGTWNERMEPGEFAVHYSSFVRTAGSAPYCMVFGSIDEAEAFARGAVLERPELRCTIYDHQGLIGAPLRDIRGSKYKGESELSPRFRRWGGAILLIGGMILIVIDWAHDFRFLWPAMFGSRMLIAGLLLLVIEAMVVLHDRLKRRHNTGAERS
jgi:hypothetical protein